MLCIGMNEWLSMELLERGTKVVAVIVLVTRIVSALKLRLKQAALKNKEEEKGLAQGGSFQDKIRAWPKTLP